MLKNTRFLGFLKLLGGAVFFAVGFVWVMNNNQDPDFGTYRGPLGPAVGVAAMGAVGLVGLIELSTGIRFTEWSRRWNDLPGWKRGVLGLLVSGLAFAALLGILYVLAVKRII